MVTTVADRILSAAVEASFEQGVAGLRVDDVAARAAANKRMIYHYFGNREGLVQAVLTDQWLLLRDHGGFSSGTQALLEAAVEQAGIVAEAMAAVSADGVAHDVLHRALTILLPEIARTAVDVEGRHAADAQEIVSLLFPNIEAASAQPVQRKPTVRLHPTTREVQS